MNTKATSPLHFSRFEFKYILSAQKRSSLENELNYFLQLDPFVRDKQDHKYTVRSLYFDDASFTAFNDKVDGLHSRSKFRVRTYSRSIETNAPVFLEIKGRHNNLVFKHRVLIDNTIINSNDASGSCLIANMINTIPESIVSDQFKYDVYRKGISPVALIDYARRPYVSKYDPTFRLTFDDSLTVQKTKAVFPNGNAPVAKMILAGYTVLEVKFQHHIPSWFHRLIQAYELKRISISKICSGMEALGLAFDES
ncbi:MAG TPA: polyphosphate polymerase domain-containing protein [Crenotrichaceae bacterium]|nr:polyphosphate polymerase domain-containing protein [Crenotrichaceae bacterium]